MEVVHLPKIEKRLFKKRGCREGKTPFPIEIYEKKLKNKLSSFEVWVQQQFWRSLLLYWYKTITQVSRNSKYKMMKMVPRWCRLQKSPHLFDMINCNTVLKFWMSQLGNLFRLGVSSIFEIYDIKYQATYSNEELCTQNASFLQV